MGYVPGVPADSAGLIAEVSAGSCLKRSAEAGLENCAPPLNIAISPAVPAIRVAICDKSYGYSLPSEGKQRGRRVVMAVCLAV